MGITIVVAVEITLLGLAAIITAIGGIVTTVLAHRSSGREARQKAEEECVERLRNVRAEAEGLAEELHRIKMKHWERE